MIKTIFLILCVISMALSQSFPWRETMNNTCWTNSSCRRSLIISHGGDWTINYPYDSLPAFQRAYEFQADSVKGDFRVSLDNVGVVMHSSPIQLHESINCWKKRVEKITAKECTACYMAGTEHHFITVPHLLSWAKGKVIVMLCVKEPRDIPRAISTIIENNAQDRAFLEIKVGDLHNIKNATGWNQVYYLAEGRSANDFNTILTPQYSWLLPRIFGFEYDDGWKKWGIDIPQSIALLHSKGVKAIVPTETHWYPSVEEQEAYYRTGFDIVYTYDTRNGVKARDNIDKERGIQNLQKIKF